MEGGSPASTSCIASSTACPGRISTSPAPRGRRRTLPPCPRVPRRSACASSSAWWPSITRTSAEGRGMTEIGFYHLRTMPLERALPRIVERALAEGHRVVVIAGSAERVDHLDALLWTYDEASFLPHGCARDGNAETQPTSLPTAHHNPHHATTHLL